MCFAHKTANGEVQSRDALPGCPDSMERAAATRIWQERCVDEAIMYGTYGEGSKKPPMPRYPMQGWKGIEIVQHPTYTEIKGLGHAVPSSTLSSNMPLASMLTASAPSAVAAASLLEGARSSQLASSLGSRRPPAASALSLGSQPVVSVPTNGQSTQRRGEAFREKQLRLLERANSGALSSPVLQTAGEVLGKRDYWR